MYFPYGLIKLSCSIVIIIANTAVNSNISHPFLRHDYNLDVSFVLDIGFPVLVFLSFFPLSL